METGENFSDEQQENLRIENEILKIKLRAQFGDAFEMEINEGMPPEIENQFLKSMMAFEEEHASTEYTTVYERIRRPAWKPLADMSRPELKIALQGLLQLLEKHDIDLDIADGPYPDELIYQFITEELFAIKVEKKPIAGLNTHFIYEEFHPNHKAAITKRTHTFLKNWFNKKFTEYCTEISWHCISADGVQLTREDMVSKMDIFFDAFTQFKNEGYKLNDISFELMEGTERGMGFAEGVLKYDAVIDKDESIHYEGPYKLYFQLEDNWWSIFYFVVPGFKW